LETRTESGQRQRLKNSSSFAQLESGELKPSVPDIGSIPFVEGDIPKAVVNAVRQQKVAALDIETSGLDWRSEQIGLCQLWVEKQGLSIVKVKKSKVPANLVALIADSSIQKIFHHAMFDLRFISYHWRVTPANIACTKIASKLLDPGQVQGHTLASLLSRHLGVVIDKSKRKSDWLSWGLSEEQLTYAGNDVLHLPKLLEVLLKELEAKGLADLAKRCFAHIPTQVELELRGYKDIYGY
jgi:ribonuclease D